MTNPRQMRRHARRIRRSGLQPMMLITSNDQLPDTALVVIMRWVGRYRSELAPVVPAVAAVLTGWWLHARDPYSWPLIAGIATVAAWVLIAFGNRLGLPTRGERLYAAAVALAIGGWLAAATILGPFSSPLPQVLIARGLALAVPWWAHGRRRARVRVERKLAAWPEIAQAAGLTGSQVMSAVSRTPPPPRCCSCAGTAWSAALPGRARAAASTC
ncbi:MAG TPA: hypothetical protein VMV92_20630 [Streptosporangiaceae bacterium]|nr:hypothetical protein [Streptosporangiaceae bacterium]